MWGAPWLLVPSAQTSVFCQFIKTALNLHRPQINWKILLCNVKLFLTGGKMESQTSNEITSCLHVCQFVQAIKWHPIMWGCSSPWQCSMSHCEVTATKAFVEFMIKTERVSLHTSMHAHTNTVYKYTVHSLSLSLSFPPSNSTLVSHSPSLKINAALQPKIAFCILYSS